VRWLLDVVPGEYRDYEVLRRHPVTLSRFAVTYLEACLTAARDGFATARRDLGDRLEVDVLEAVLAAYEREGRRLRLLSESARQIDAALRGERYVARL
jgi:hypothetical protein